MENFFQKKKKINLKHTRVLPYKENRTIKKTETEKKMNNANNFKNSIQHSITFRR